MLRVCAFEMDSRTVSEAVFHLILRYEISNVFSSEFSSSLSILVPVYLHIKSFWSSSLALSPAPSLGCHPQSVLFATSNRSTYIRFINIITSDLRHILTGLLSSLTGDWMSLFCHVSRSIAFCFLPLSTGSVGELLSSWRMWRGRTLLTNNQRKKYIFIYFW